ncbi:Ldh family oxidoreductase [Xinfangfangia sp. CPCC 101601]|uniref:Ldh family oxidoreductase n=1 Tax=Pseudogemmobacter lacusdianii TaxID=3069608 RepID=A0ABU0VUZ6_9RHOB|nr:Ldh family oxidoreductase [Xinfangfangia sp. CPCC 101601]MDQ2065554.1 Ldh family oxidoreductase [Xinfangfangia sp. CPCC 101601]
MSDDLRMTEAELMQLAVDFLTAQGLERGHATSMASVLCAAQRDGSLSHGLQRLPGTRDTIGHPAFQKAPQLRVEQVTPAVLKVDADYGFAVHATMSALPQLIASAKALGIAFMAVRNGFHSTALWPVVEALAEAGLVGLSMNPTHDWVVPAGGTKPVLGTNPMAFAWPRPGQPPYVFDFATTAAARADIAMARNEGRAIPEGWGLDPEGQPTTDPAAVLAGAMLPFGGHKGSALATMIELMAGPMIGGLTSAASARFDEGHKAAPCHAELVIAIDPKLLSDPSDEAAAEAMLGAISGQGARLPGARRHGLRDVHQRDGIPLRHALYEQILAGIAGR